MKSVFFFILLFSGLAQAETAFDQGRMPRCIGDGHREVFFLWNEADPYAREIYYLDSATLEAQGVSTSSDHRCRAIYTKFSDVDADDLTPLPAQAKMAGPFAIDSLQTAFSQIRNGANVLHEATAGHFLSSHPIRRFTVETNRELTASYGVGFASEVYAQTLLQDSGNKKFRAGVGAHLKTGVGQLTAGMKGREIIYVKGLGHELPSSKVYDVLVTNLRAAGVPVKIVTTKSYDTIMTNAALVKTSLDEELRRGKRVILIGLSKGGTEALLALAMLTSKLEGSARPAGYGHVDAYLGLSGVYAGSFVVDWGAKLPQYVIMGEVLGSEYEKEGLTLPSLDGILDLQTSHVSVLMNWVSYYGLPQSTTYFNVIGTMLGNGMAKKDSYIRTLQDEMIRSQLSDYGANDGYIEYPGTAIPKSLVRKQYAVTINASHSLIDGSFNLVPTVGSSLSVMNGIFLSMLDLIAP